MIHSRARVLPELARRILRVSMRRHHIQSRDAPNGRTRCSTTMGGIRRAAGLLCGVQPSPPSLTRRETATSSTTVGRHSNQISAERARTRSTAQRGSARAASARPTRDRRERIRSRRGRRHLPGLSSGRGESLERGRSSSRRGAAVPATLDPASAACLHPSPPAALAFLRSSCTEPTPGADGASLAQRSSRRGIP